ncbi:MAG: FhaA domain-containing protein [Rubrobacter sp.]
MLEGRGFSLGFLKGIEKKMGGLVEGVFGRAFRRRIHPVEIAKGLTKQMDEGRMVSISRTYAPNDFTIHLSEDDAVSINVYEDSLRDELIQYASSHAESKSYHLMTPPKVRFTTEDSLRFGEFGVTAKLTGGDGPREKGAPQDTSGQTRIFKTEQITNATINEGTSAISAEEARHHGLAREVVELAMNGKNHPLQGSGPWSVGRSQDNDIVISDPNVSRNHARLIREENGFVLEDLGSTNGTLLDGAPIGRERIESGDELTFGQSTARFVRRIEEPGRSIRERRGGNPSGRD